MPSLNLFKGSLFTHYFHKVVKITLANQKFLNITNHKLVLKGLAYVASYVFHLL